MASPAPKLLRIGVMLDEVQLSDIVGIDILGNISVDYVNEVSAFAAEFAPFKPSAIPIQFFYLSSTLDPVRQTPKGFHVVPNTTYDDCPRDLDIVITGGPSPLHRPEPAMKFIREAWETTRVWMTTCIGAAWIADAGVLKGRKATTNRPFIPMVEKMHPDVEWIDQRWVVDEKPFKGKDGDERKGELWTSGGAGAGRFCFNSARAMIENGSGG
jgi:transcriptional regulator GlxA family with amidase domain